MTDEKPVEPTPAPDALPEPVNISRRRDVREPLNRARRALRWAIREEGQYLWTHRWLEAALRPLLIDALEVEELGESAAVARAAEALSGLDAMPWTERLEPATTALEALDQALAEYEPTPVEQARARRLEVADEKEIEAAPSRSRSRRSSTRSARPKPDAAPAKPRHPLGAPEATGKPVATLGASAALVEALTAAGVNTIEDLLVCLPKDHEIVPLVAEVPEESGEVALAGVIKARWVRLGPAGRTVEMQLVLDGDAELRCRWLGTFPADLEREPGETVVVAGRLELIEDEGPVLYEAVRWMGAGGVVRRPNYQIEGTTEAEVRALIRTALLRYGDALMDSIPRPVLQNARVMGIEDALRALHVPAAPSSKARKRLAFDELLLFQISLAAKEQVRLRGLAHTLSHELVSRIQLQHGLELNDAQEAVFDEIRRDLRRPTAMTRLLQGDVGAGKAVVSLLTAILVASNKYQVVFLAPDAAAAEHRYLFAEPLLRSAGLLPQLVDGVPTDAQRDAMGRGETNVLFGTHEMLQKFPEFKRLGLVVVEERSEFGVVSREQIVQKGVYPDLLVVTAVPIPLSLTFTIFSQYDVSVIRDGSAQIVESAIREPDQRDAEFAAVCERLARGLQAYVVFPLIDGKDLLDLPRARQLAAALGEEAFPGYRIGLYHGGMSREERSRVHEDFERRRLDVLLSTTSIEDAPEVANATVMVIENADRYDLVRLHRLRGHVARGREPGICRFVLTANPDPAGRALVELVSKEQDGYMIAEKDRQARGDSALLGDRLDVLPGFRMANPSGDRELLLRARKAALEILVQDPRLRQRAHRELVRRLLAAYPDALPEDSGSPPPRPSATKGRRRRRRRRGGGGA